MKKVILFTKAYGKNRKQLLDLIQSDISNMIKDVDVRLARFTTDKRGHIILSLDGQDAEFAINVLYKKYGKSILFEDINEGQTYSGVLVDVGKVGYGIYVDISITTPKRIDALIPLHRIRHKFSMNKSLRTIVASIVLVDNLPIDIKITNIDKSNQKVEADFGQNTLDRFEKWVHDDHERLLVFGANKDMIEKALRKSGHLEDIYEIEDLGLFEYALRCKRSTRASGILAAIGPKLQGIPMHLFIPKEIEANLNA